MPAGTEPDHAAPILVVSTETAELRRRLAATQDLLVEMASEVGELRGRLETIRADLAEVRAARDA